MRVTGRDCKEIVRVYWMNCKRIVRVTGRDCKEIVRVYWMNCKGIVSVTGRDCKKFVNKWKAAVICICINSTSSKIKFLKKENI